MRISATGGYQNRPYPQEGVPYPQYCTWGYPYPQSGTATGTISAKIKIFDDHIRKINRGVLISAKNPKKNDRDNFLEQYSTKT